MKPLNEYEQALRCAYAMLQLRGADVTADNLAAAFGRNYTPLDDHELTEFRRMIGEWAVVAALEITLAGPREHNPYMLADFILKFAENLSKWRAAKVPLDRFMKGLH